MLTTQSIAPATSDDPLDCPRDLIGVGDVQCERCTARILEGRDVLGIARGREHLPVFAQERGCSGAPDAGRTAGDQDGLLAGVTVVLVADGFAAVPCRLSILLNNGALRPVVVGSLDVLSGGHT